MSSSTAPSRASSDVFAAHGSAALVRIRTLQTLADYRACVELQREIWGEAFDEVVPASLMRAAGHIGALVIGAYTEAGMLAGFVFGLTGVKEGELVHWSHMLGVRAELRDQGVGQRLKEAQRAELARDGIRRMYWTFDPLQARNAHLNINRLGARVIEYVADMYGASQSPLHNAVGTDRLVVECCTTPGASADGRRDATAPAGPVYTPFPREGDVLPGGTSAGRGLIEVPWDLQEVVAQSAATAQAWREATRQYFQWALANEYEVTSLYRDGFAGRVFFVIERAAESIP